MDYSSEILVADPAPSSDILGPIFIIYLVVLSIISLAYLAASWKIFTKAGRPGWAVLIPIYNLVVYLQIVGRPAWWFLLLFVPFVNFAISIMLSLDLAKAFNKTHVFGIIALWFLPVGYFILGFGSAKYTRPGATPAPSSNPPPAPSMPSSEPQITPPAPEPPVQGPPPTTI